MKLEITGQILEKYSNTRFHENPDSGSLTDGRTDGCDEASSRFSQFCERA